MAVGTTTVFAQARDSILQDALTNVGALGPNGTATGDQLAHANRALSRIVQSLDAEGAAPWKTARRTFTLTAATATSTAATDVIDIDEPMSYRASASATARSLVRVMTRDEYMTLTDRTTAGIPTMALIEKTIATNTTDLLTVTWYPVPNVTGAEIEYAAALRRLDFTDGSTNADFPARWTDCLIYGLSASLAMPYGQPAIAAQYQDLFLAERDKLVNFDTERGNLVIVPFGGSY